MIHAYNFSDRGIKLCFWAGRGVVNMSIVKAFQEGNTEFLIGVKMLCAAPGLLIEWIEGQL